VTGAEHARALAETAARLEQSAGPPNGDGQRLRDLIVEVAAQSRYGLAADAVRASRPLAARWPGIENDAFFQRTLAYLAWIAGDPPASLAAGMRSLCLDPGNAQVYTMLGWAHLSASQWAEAFLALSAGALVAPQDGGLRSWRRLAELLMRDVDNVEFEVDGKSYKFGLSCFSNQAMETSVMHAHGQLSELEELRFVRDSVGKARVVVEVGTLVGNHAVYLARNLSPEKVYCFDADARSVEHTTANFRLNFPAGSPPHLVAVNKAIGGTPRTIEFAGRPVEVTTLEAEVKEPVDFIKVDVDGMEIEVLSGARSLFVAHRPRALIEVTTENIPAFHAFVASIGYSVLRSFPRPADTNFFIAPASGSAAMAK
jgi:hypothetical protein